MIVLGIHGGVTLGQHEPSAALLIDGRVVAVCEEERYLRIKSCYGYLPHYSIKACLALAGISADDIDLVVSAGVTYDFFESRLREYLKSTFGITPKIHLVHHQEAHLAAAFYSTNSEQALCLSLDATGDGSSGFVAKASRTSGIEVLERIPTQNSIGFFYSLITSYLGFEDGDEYKVMGLAAYGEPSVDLRPVIEARDGVWRFDWSYIRSEPPLRSPFEPKHAPKLAELLKENPRLPHEPIQKFHKDLARSAQLEFERALEGLVLHYHKRFPDLRELCYAGGVALNCVANSALFYRGWFDKIHVPPVASDRGLSLGAAYLGAVIGGDSPLPITSAALGSSYTNDQIAQELRANGISFRELSSPAVTTAELLSHGKIVGWFQGRSEAGARALGSRSIIANPRTKEMQEKVNRRIKYRESFRPFAPSVLLERSSDYFDNRGKSSPYMCFTFRCIKEREGEMGAITHADGTARVQTVQHDEAPLYHELISAFHSLTGTPLILNTSFNLKGQPIVESPRDALMTFFGCGLDALVLGPFLVEKTNPLE